MANKSNTGNKSNDNKTTTSQKAKDMAGEVFQEGKKGLLGWISELVKLFVAGLIGNIAGSSGSSSNDKLEDAFKDNRFILSRKDERLYFNAKDSLNFEEQKKMGLFEKVMEESCYDFDFFRKNIANIQDEHEKSKSPDKSPATKRLKMIIRAKNFEDQILIVGSGLGQKEFFEKKTVQTIDKTIGGMLIVVGVSVILILVVLFAVVLANI